MLRPGLLAISFAVALAIAPTVWSDGDGLGGARALLLRGRYAEAIETAKRLEGADPIDALLIQADALAETGRVDEAQKLLDPLYDREVDNLHFMRGLALLGDRHWPHRGLADAAFDQALKLGPNDLVARWLKVKRLLEQEKWEGVRRELAWFAEAVNPESGHPTDSAEAALALASGLAEHARWSRESKWFNVAVNEVLGKAEKKYPLHWRIPYERAQLFAERHNEPAAVDSLNAALTKNGSAAELHGLRARLAIDKFDLVAARRCVEQARRLNPRLPEIALVEVDIAFAELQPQRALEVLSKAERDFTLSGSEFTGRRFAASEALRRKAGPAAADLVGGSARPFGHQYLIAKGDALDRMRRFSQARDAYREALHKLPQFPGYRAKLAHELLRLGEEEEGAKLLAEAQQEDPFDVRVKNTLAVLDVLSTYATLETDHFIVRFDRGRDELLARYVADYLEYDVYPDLVKRFRYEPRGKSLIEIYNRAKNTSGHGWFSARMVGVPGLHTIGACAGKIVALASPTDMPRPYNWARVLRHEFVHLLNLEQTAFNVPHWVTEGLAVTAEDRPRPSAWTRLLTQRYEDDKLFTLADVNFGFIRPSDSNDWTCAYAQAELYIEFLTATYGEESVPRLLLAFQENLSTEAAIEQASGVQVDAFEQGYRDYLGKLVESWGLQSSTASQNVERLKKKLATEPMSAELHAAIAAAHLAKGELPLARKHAQQATKLSPGQPTATFVLASLAKASQDLAGAARIAQGALDPKSPHEGLLLLLADLKLADKQFAVAEKLLLLGQRRFPSLDQWNLRLAKLYAKQKDDARLEAVLLELVGTQEDDASLPARLTEFALARQDFAAVERWARATLQIDVRQPAAHAHLAAALIAADKPAAALAEWEAAVQYDDQQPKQHPQWKLELARLLIKSDQRERATTLLEQLVKTSPGLPGLVEVAQELRSEPPAKE